MSQPERPVKISKLLRLKGQEFLSKGNSDYLVEIIQHFESGADPISCLLTLEMVFTQLLRDRRMLIEIVPLKPIEKSPENEYKQQLRNIYEQCFNNVLNCIERDSQKIQFQGNIETIKNLNNTFLKHCSSGLSTAMNLLSNEGRFPIESKGSYENYVPLNKLKGILSKLLFSKHSMVHLINKYTEYLMYDDILFFTWKVLPLLTAKTNPNDIYILNYLHLLEKMQTYPNTECRLLCGNDNGKFPVKHKHPVTNLTAIFRMLFHIRRKHHETLSEQNLALCYVMGAHATNSQTTVSRIIRTRFATFRETITVD